MRHITIRSVFCLATLLYMSQLIAQTKATISIKKNQNGVVTEETKSIILEDGKSIESVLSEMGVMDEMGHLKEGQQFEIKIDKFSHGDSPSFNYSITPDINSFPPVYGKAVTEKRPFLGVILKEKNEKTNNQDIRFVEVSQVEPGSAAEKAGILQGDRLLQLEGTDIHTSAEFVKIIQSKQIGDKIKLVVERNGKKKKLNATLGEKMMEVRHPLGSNGTQNWNEEKELPLFNFRFGPDSITILSPRKDSVKICQPFAWHNDEMVVKETPYLGVMPFQGNSKQLAEGTMINVQPETPAEKMGLITGDVIVRFNEASIKSFDDLAKAVAQSKVGEEVIVVVLREGKQKELNGTLGKRNCSHYDDFRIFHDFKGMDEGGNYFYDYEFDMDMNDIERHMEQLMEKLENDQALQEQLKKIPHDENELLSQESITISIRIDEISDEEKETINKQANPKIGAGEALGFESISFYPNPNNGLLNLNFTTTDIAPVKVVLYDNLGNTVYFEERTLADGSYQNRIDIADQPNGSYYLQIIQGNKSYSKKIIKNS